MARILELVLNGRRRVDAVPDNLLLLDYLREVVGLTGTKTGCDGGEYAFTHVISGFVEYNYYDFGTRQIAFTPQVVGLGPAFVDINETKSVVRAGLNLRFGYAAPGTNH